MLGLLELLIRELIAASGIGCLLLPVSVGVVSPHETREDRQEAL